MRKDIITGLVIILFVTMWSTVAPLPSSQSKEMRNVSILSDYVPQSPILIEDSTNGSEFESLGFSGNGTMGDPYVIEGLSIDGTGVSPCIEIRNPRANTGTTSCYFVIRDCYLYNGFDGIYMTDATVGVIENNMIVDSADGWGIDITQGATVGLVYNITIRNNDLSNNYNDNSITTDRAWNWTIANNTSNGLARIGFPRNTTVSNNTFSDIVISGSSIYRSDCSILNNTVDSIEISNVIDIVNHESVIDIVNNTILDRMWIQDSENCQVTGNDFVAYRRWMLFLLNGDNNVFTSNVFNLTDIDELFNIDTSSEGNSFDYNFYSDYEGVDENDDNIGDTPYDKWDVVDQHPLMSLRGYEVVPQTTTTTTSTITTTTTPTTSITTDTASGTPTGADIPIIMVISLVGGICGIAAIIIVIVVIRKQN